MEAANRWETEAIRESRERRRGRPTVSQQRETPRRDGDWRTLREASIQTGIPIGTLRKWCRRESVDSYLESDGEQTLRMLEMGSVERNAKALGRELESRQTPVPSPQPEESYQPPAASHQPERDPDSPEPSADSVPTTDYRLPTTAGEAGQAGNTMIVPVDAWNKMLNQLGNLHEAGQQLAEARERAGKAETEAKFLRERLAEMREESRQSPVPSPQPEPDESYQTPDASPQPEDSRQTPDTSPQPEDSHQTPDTSPQPVESRRTPDASPQPEEDPQTETTAFWRYVVRGWRGRRR